MKRTLVCTALLVVSSAAFFVESTPAAPAGKPTTHPATRQAYPSTDHYEVRQIEGWKVYVQKEIDPRTCKDALRLLEVKLYDITRAVPPKALASLRAVPIWMGVKDVNGRHPCACYHPDRQWLIDNHYNPDMAGAVEIANAETFLKWSHGQPQMVLHELAHGYHHQVLTHQNAKVRAAYRHAVESKKYDAILRSNGRRERAYAMNNEQEYFAELTEAYFGENDFFPFVRIELKEHDPEGCKMVQEAWGAGGGR